jgi:hypothetical protein
MQAILDNLVATVIGMTIILILVTVQHRSQVVMADAANFYAMRQYSLAFIENIQYDMRNLLSVEHVTESADSTFVMNLYDPVSDAVQRVTYKRQWHGVRGDTQLYRVTRSVEGQPNAVAMPVINDWKITVMNEEGQPVANPSDARRVVVTFETIPPYGRGDPVGRTRWEATFHPPMLGEVIL